MIQQSHLFVCQQFELSIVMIEEISLAIRTSLSNCIQPDISCNLRGIEMAGNEHIMRWISPYRILHKTAGALTAPDDQPILQATASWPIQPHPEFFPNKPYWNRTSPKTDHWFGSQREPKRNSEILPKCQCWHLPIGPQQRERSQWD